MAALSSSRAVRGLIPALDRKQVSEAFVCNGRNFLVDAQGPYSAFGSELSSYEKIQNRLNITTFRIIDFINETIYVFTEDEILVYDPASLRYHPALVFESKFDEIAPWTTARIAGKYYFARRGLQMVIQYDPMAGAFKVIQENVPNEPVAVTESAGRLVILGDEVVGWSAIDDGENLLPSTDTGAGQQSLAIIGGGKAYKVLKTNDGFISYTSVGLMKSEWIDSINPFRHFPLSVTEADKQSADIPIDAFNVIDLEEGTHVIMSESGLRVTSGQKPEEWQPLFSEYLRQQLLPTLDLRVDYITQLHYNSARKLFFISIAEQQIPGKFTKSYVLYLPRDEWGTFCRDHAAFGEFALTQEETTAFNFGYFGIDGTTHRFVEFPQVEANPPYNQIFCVRPAYEFIARQEDGSVRFSSVMQVRSVDKYSFPAERGYYYYNTFNSYQRDMGSIDSFVDVGVFRYTNEKDVDALSYIVMIAIGMIEGPAAQTFIDYNQPETADIFVDYAEPVGQDVFVDYGSGSFSGTKYTVELIGTLDGYNQYENQREKLVEIQPNPLQAARERTKFYDAYTVGLYHILSFKALNRDESFHLKFLELSGNLAGRL